MASVNEHGALRQAFRGLKNNKKEARTGLLVSLFI